MILNRFFVQISILKSIWLKMTTVWLWFVKKVQRSIPTKQIFHTVTQFKFDKLVRNFDKNIIWNHLDIFSFKTQNWYFPPQQLEVTFSSKRGFRLWVFSIVSHINMSDISREIYRYIVRNISTDYFFLNKHPSSTKNFPHQWQFFGRSLKLTRIITYFQTCDHEKLTTTFFTTYFPSPSVCHKNLRFCWKLLGTIISILSNWEN